MSAIKSPTKSSSLLGFLKSHTLAPAIAVVVLSLLVNSGALVIPLLNSRIIDSMRETSFDQTQALLAFGILTLSVLVLTLVQNLTSAYTAEKIAAELRRQLIDKISRQSFRYINSVSSAKLLTNLTADVDAVKSFINLGLVLAFSAVVQLIGSAILLLSLNWQLAIPILLTIPVLAIAFGIIFSRIERYFKQAQEVIDALNRVINENVVGSAIIRVLHSFKSEKAKFEVANSNSREVGLNIVNGFAALIPVISMIVNISFLIVLGYGGVQVIDGTLSAGNFSAFFSYIFIFISPIIMIGFLAGQVGRAFATYTRIWEVITSEIPPQEGDVAKELKGKVEVENITLDLNNKRILDAVSFTAKPGERVGIIGPTAAGKTQIFYIITGLIDADSGSVQIDDTLIQSFDKDSLYSQIGMVFQDNVIFNTTIRENIAFRNPGISEERIWKAIETAELKDFIATLPDGLETQISERGTSLSGGQKQRLSLARALALEPKILLLDDFTARVDINTEKRIFENLKRSFPKTTIIAITQKISSVMDFDNVILVMEGEVVAKGKHDTLLDTSLEYQQIFKSQQRTED